jgi:hypothetical protein
MITISRIGSALQRFFENMAKARVNSVLLGMDRQRLAEMGYSYQLLEQGPKAWPWRESNQDGAPQADAMIRPTARIEPAHSVENASRRERQAATPHATGFDAGRDAA